MEKRRCKHVMRSIENRLNRASNRAEENLKKKQGRAARRSRRLERAQNKRALVELERRSSVLASLGDRTERATRNLQLRLEDLQEKARIELERAHDVAKRVKAVRILQHFARTKFGFKEQFDQAHLSITSAVLRIQNCNTWKCMVIAKRLLCKNDIQSLKDLLNLMGHPHGSSKKSFEELAAAITHVTSLKAANSILSSCNPLLSKSVNLMRPEAISARTLLSAFLVAMQPEEVLAEKRGNDRCSELLEKAALALIDTLTELSNLQLSHGKQSQINNIIDKVCTKILSYCTLFDKWKNADFDDLVEKMSKSARSSWIAYLTAKEALLYIEQRYPDKNKHFRHLIKYKSSKKGAGSHIKRIRAAVTKLLGEDQSLSLMKEEKNAAISHIEKEQLINGIKADIDRAVISCEDDLKGDSCVSNIPKAKEQKKHTTDNVFFNSQLVHNILLMDSEDLKDVTNFGFANSSHYCDAEDFMEHFRGQAINLTVDSNMRLLSTKKLIAHLIHKMRDLIPNRKDLHQYFTEDHMIGCETSTDYFRLTLNMANAMMKSLESENRSASTLEWYNVTSEWQKNKDAPLPYSFNCWQSYLEASITFLIGKVDLCQMDIVNFQLLNVAPVIKANGKEYEINQFQEKFGKFEAYKDLKYFSATRTWIRRVKDKNQTESLFDQLKIGFVDEILFATERIAIPEVSSL